MSFSVLVRPNCEIVKVWLTLLLIPLRNADAFLVQEEYFMGHKENSEMYWTLHVTYTLITSVAISYNKETAVFHYTNNIQFGAK